MSNNSSETTDYIISPADFKTAVQDGSEISIVFRSLKPTIEAQIIKIIHRYLAKYDILYIKDVVVVAAKELINNAVKANLKRIYFHEKGLNIDEISDYRNGMEGFKSDVFQDDSFQDDYMDKLEQSKLKVGVIFKPDSENLHLTVKNNSKILDAELKKVQTRVEKATKYADISEVFEDVLDDSEGAGLGLMMSIMMMKNSGFKPSSYSIRTDEKNTISSIIIPQKFTEEKTKENISNKILSELKEIPSFPENIMHIKQLCEDPESTVKNISEHISTDPGLTASILKLANSAGYFSMKKAETIEEAVVKIGFKGVDTLLTASGVCSIMDTKYKNKIRQYDTVWKNSYKRAYYAQKIALEYKLAKINEMAYLSALLIDIGKIVLLSINPELSSKIKDIVGNKDMENFNVVEEMSLGMSFSYLGSLICKKWNFSDTITYAIEFSKKPYMAETNYKPLVNIVYLSDCMVNIDNKKTRFDFIDEDILSFFKLEKRESFEKLHNYLRENYQPHN